MGAAGDDDDYVEDDADEAPVSGNTSVIAVSLFIATVIVCVFLGSLWYNKQKGNSLLQLRDLKKDLEVAQRESVRLKKEMEDARAEARRDSAEHLFQIERAALHSYGPDPHSC